MFAINYANEDKDKEIARLTKLLSERDTEIAKLAGLLAESQKEVADLKILLAAMTEERNRLRTGIFELVKQLEGVSIGLRGEQGRLEGVRRDLLLALQSNLDKRGVKVDVDAGQGILRLASESLFDTDRDSFTPAGEKNARALLEEMARLLPCYSQASSGSDCATRQPIFETVLIEGHTDTRPTERRGGNWTLSTDRARAFMELMVGPASSLRDLRNVADQPLLGLAGYGDSRPRPGILGGDERNRRIETRFLLSGQRENLADRIKRLDDLLDDLRSLAVPKP
ncbi:MAG: OmpA family protein [Alphaproteobacteria bacterium]|nr:OmpA family protein [Alphaproteobacteria bacterium]